MSQENICYLCDGKATIHSALDEGKDANFVECETCGKYYFDEPPIYEVEYREKLPSEKKAMLSAYTREQYELGKEPPELGDPDTLKATISFYENKTIDEKVENLIWYLRKNSKEYGDAVPWEAEKDYPITYSFGSEGFMNIRNLAIEKGLVVQPEGSGVGLRLKEDGFRWGTELMEKREGN